LLRGSQHLVRAGSDADIFGEVAPANNLGRVHQKLGWPCDVVSIRPASRVQQVVAPNHRGIGIRKNRESVSRFVGKIARQFRRINANRDRTYSRRLELRQPFLYTS
jgi:hypothetical protein